jgi:hypothetical protein
MVAIPPREELRERRVISSVFPMLFLTPCFYSYAMRIGQSDSLMIEA